MIVLNQTKPFKHNHTKNFIHTIQFEKAVIRDITSSELLEINIEDLSKELNVSERFDMFLIF